MKIDALYFSPTGGTKKVGDCFCEAMGSEVNHINLGEQAAETAKLTGDLIVVAAPVFGGRIPSVVAKKLKNMNGEGRKAVAIVVYGNRAYEDALLELKDTLEGCNCNVIGAGAFVAQHSMAPQVGQGRPDDRDKQEIREFAKEIMANVEGNSAHELTVPGNKPYKAAMSMPVSPVSLAACIQCGQCKKACPTSAIRQEGNAIVTDTDKCILCMACVAACPEKARILPPPLAAQMEQMLGALKTVRRKNEYFV